MASDKIRVLRIIEYTGPREAIEDQINRSIHGTRVYNHRLGEVRITVATIGNYPEVIEAARQEIDDAKRQDSRYQSSR